MFKSRDIHLDFLEIDHTYYNLSYVVHYYTTHIHIVLIYCFIYSQELVCADSNLAYMYGRKTLVLAVSSLCFLHAYYCNAIMFLLILPLEVLIIRCLACLFGYFACRLCM